jgi:hypothetical protein
LVATSLANSLDTIGHAISFCTTLPRLSHHFGEDNVDKARVAVKAWARAAKVWTKSASEPRLNGKKLLLPNLVVQQCETPHDIHCKTGRRAEAENSKPNIFLGDYPSDNKFLESIVWWQTRHLLVLFTHNEILVQVGASPTQVQTFE